MTTTPRNLKQIGLFAITASSLLLIAKPSQAVIADLSPADFSTGTGVSVSNASSPINQNEFDIGFTSDFLILGANQANANIGNSVDDANFRSESNVFSINQYNINQGSINVAFNWAFDGNSTGSAGDQDNFSITLRKFLTPTTSSIAAPIFSRSTANTGFGYGAGSEFVSVNTNTLNANDSYFIRVALNENSEPTNSAFGINDIEVVAVPFEFSPAQGLLAVGGFWGVSTFIKRRKANTSNLDLA